MNSRIGVAAHDGRSDDEHQGNERNCRADPERRWPVVEFDLVIAGDAHCAEQMPVSDV